MRRILPFIVILLIALPVRAEVRKTTSVEYYRVLGRTAADIINSMKRLSPVKLKGKTFHAHTRSNIRYKVSWTKRGDRCSISKATVNIHITYKYPRLAQTPADRKTRMWWQKFIGGLKEHELIHGRIALEGAHRVDKALNSLKSIRCDNIKNRIKAKADSILQEVRREQVEYDRVTEHGLKQERYRGPW